MLSVELGGVLPGDIRALHTQDMNCFLDWCHHWCQSCKYGPTVGIYLAKFHHYIEISVKSIQSLDELQTCHIIMIDGCFLCLLLPTN